MVRTNLGRWKEENRQSQPAALGSGEESGGYK